MDEFGVGIRAAGFREQAFEIVEQLVLILEAQEGFCVAGVAAVLFERCALQYGHPGAVLHGGDGGRHARDAVSHDNDVEFAHIDGHLALPSCAAPCASYYSV